MCGEPERSQARPDPAFRTRDSGRSRNILASQPFIHTSATEVQSIELPGRRRHLGTLAPRTSCTTGIQDHHMARWTPVVSASHSPRPSGTLKSSRHQQNAGQYARATCKIPSANPTAWRRSEHIMNTESSRVHAATFRQDDRTIPPDPDRNRAGLRPDGRHCSGVRARLIDPRLAGCHVRAGVEAMRRQAARRIS